MATSLLVARWPTWSPSPQALLRLPRATGGIIDFRSGSPGTTFDGNGDYVSGQAFEVCQIEYGGFGAGGGVIRHPTFINNGTITNNIITFNYAGLQHT